MSGWHTQHYAEKIGISVKRYLRERLEAGYSYAAIAREVGAKNRQAISRLVKRHGLTKPESQS